MNNIEGRRELEYYLSRKYPITLHEDSDGGYVTTIDDLPGCMTEGDTTEQALQNIDEAREFWIRAAYDDGQTIPLPRGDAEYSGKFIVRVPRSLHRRLAQAAEREGVSLNLYVTSLLGEGVSNSHGTVVHETKPTAVFQMVGKSGDATKPRGTNTMTCEICNTSSSTPDPARKNISTKQSHKPTSLRRG